MFGKNTNDESRQLILKRRFQKKIVILIKIMKMMVNWKRPIFSSALIYKINRIFQIKLRLLRFIYYEKKKYGTILYSNSTFFLQNNF